MIKSKRKVLTMQKHSCLPATSLLILPFIPLFCVLHGENAGVLPYAQHKGKIYFLLGKERSNRTWSDFGGAGNKGETPKQTAKREFHEETRNIYKKIPIRLGKPILHPQRYYNLYLAQVPYKTKNEIETALGKDREKTDFKWVDAQYFIKTIQEEYAKNKMNKHKDPRKNIIYDSKKGPMLIREQFVPFFTIQKKRNKIERLIGLKSKKNPSKLSASPSESKPTESKRVATPLKPSICAQVDNFTPLLNKLTNALQKLRKLLRI